MVDLIARLALPVLVAARATLGTINHTLLTIEALRARAVPSPVSSWSGRSNADNRVADRDTTATSRWSAKCLPLDPLTPEALRRRCGAWRRGELDACCA